MPCFTKNMRLYDNVRHNIFSSLPAIVSFRCIGPSSRPILGNPNSEGTNSLTPAALAASPWIYWVDKPAIPMAEMTTSLSLVRSTDASAMASVISTEAKLAFPGKELVAVEEPGRVTINTKELRSRKAFFENFNNMADLEIYHPQTFETAKPTAPAPITANLRYVGVDIL